MTTYGDLAQKLDYTFDFYDCNKNGELVEEDIVSGIDCMLGLIGAKRESGLEAEQITKQCMKLLNVDDNGKITRGKL
jgi:hypothetical protein